MSFTPPLITPPLVYRGRIEIQLDSLTVSPAEDLMPIIQKTHQRGLFEPFKEVLEKADYYKVLQNQNPIADEVYVFLCMLAVAIDPEYDDGTKRSEIEKCLNKVRKERLPSLFRCFSHCMEITWPIFNYGPQSLWDYARTLDLPILLKLIQGVIHASSPLPLKQTFLDNLFSSLPGNRRRDFIFYMLLNTSEETQANLSRIVSNSLACQIKEVTLSVAQLGSEMLNNVSRTNLSDIPLRENQRLFFLEWFYTQAIEHPNADCIAASLTESDYWWLAERARKDTRGLTTAGLFVRRCRLFLISMTNRSTRPSLSDFYKHCSNCIANLNGWNDADEDVKQLAEALKVENLFESFEAFEGTLQKRLLNAMFERSPQKLLHLIKKIVSLPTNSPTDPYTKLRDLFEIISKHGFLNFCIELVFSSQAVETTLKVTVYSCLNKEQKLQVLRNLTKHRPEGLQMLANWVTCCVREASSLQPFVPADFSLHFFALLDEIDANLASDLRTLLQSQFSNPSERSFLDDLLPSGIDLNNPIDRRNLAIRQLTRIFATPNFPHDSHRACIKTLKAEIAMRGSSSEWIPGLFARVPPCAWPLMFLHFHNDICHVTHMEAYQSHPKGEMFLEMLEQSSQNEDDSKPVSERAFQDEEQFILVAGESLNQMLSNPLLGPDLMEEAMHHIYFTACEEKNPRYVIAHFLETTSPEKFFPILNAFCRFCFSQTKNLYVSMVGKALNILKESKITFLAKAICYEHQKRMHDSQLPVGELEQQLWEDDKDNYVLLLNAAEYVELVKQLQKEMGNQFVQLLIDWPHYHFQMIKRLADIDREYCVKLFSLLILQLLESQEPPNRKLAGFQVICMSFEMAKISVNELLNVLTLDDRVLKQIQLIYSQEQAAQALDYSSAICLDLFRRFNWDVKLLFRKISLVFASVNQWQTIFCRFNAFLVLLRERQLLETFCQSLISNADVAALIKQGVKEHPSEYMLSENVAQTFHIVYTLVPELLDALIPFAKKEIEKLCKGEKDTGYKGYSPLLNYLFIHLEEVKLLTPFMDKLKNACEPELKDTFERICQHYFTNSSHQGLKRK